MAKSALDEVYDLVGRAAHGVGNFVGGIAQGGQQAFKSISQDYNNFSQKAAQINQQNQQHFQNLVPAFQKDYQNYVAPAAQTAGRLIYNSPVGQMGQMVGKAAAAPYVNRMSADVSKQQDFQEQQIKQKLNNPNLSKADKNRLNNLLVTVSKNRQNSTEEFNNLIYASPQQVGEAALGTFGSLYNPAATIGSGGLNAGFNTVMNAVQGKPLTQNLEGATQEGIRMGAILGPLEKLVGFVPGINKPGQLAAKLPLLKKAPGLTKDLVNDVWKAGVAGAGYGTATGADPLKTGAEFAPYGVLGPIGKYVVSPAAKKLISKFGISGWDFFENKAVIKNVVTGQATPQEAAKFQELNQGGKVWEMLKSLFPRSFDRAGNPKAEMTSPTKTPLNQVPELDQAFDLKGFKSENSGDGGLLQDISEEVIKDIPQLKLPGTNGTEGISAQALTPDQQKQQNQQNPNWDQELQALVKGDTPEITPQAMAITPETQVAPEAAKVEPVPGMQFEAGVLPPEGKPVDSATFDTNKYIQEQVAKQADAKESGQAQPGILAKIKEQMVDSLAPIEDVLNWAEKEYGFKILPKNDVRKQMDRALRSSTLAGQFVKDNGLEDVIKSVPNLDEMNQYMIARQALKVNADGKATGRDPIADQQLVNNLAPVYEDYAKTATDYSRKMLDYMVDSSMIAPELRDLLIQKYPDYAPLQRIFNELEKTQPVSKKGGTANLTAQTIVQKLKGSEREIQNPLESLLLKTQDMFNQGERNKAAKMLGESGQLPGMEGLVTEIEGHSSNKNTFSFLDGGVKRTFETTPAIAAAAKSLNQDQMGMLLKIISYPTRMLQLTATSLNLPFVATNILKDEVTGFVNSHHGANTSILNPYNFVRALYSTLGHDKLYDEAVRQGAMTTSFDISRTAPNLSVDKIRSGKNPISKSGYLITHPADLLRAVEDLVGRSEEFGRLKNYRGEKQALLGEGRTPQDAEILAADNARNATANFLRKGSFAKALNWVIPFFNAGIQGARQLTRSFQNAPVSTSAKVATAVFAPIAAATAWNLSDPQRAQIYQDIDDFEKDGNIIIIPPGVTKDAQGRWNVWKIPMPPGLSNLGALVRRPMEASAGLDPVGFGDIANNLFTAFTSIDVSSMNKLASTFTPQAGKGLLETVTNTNLFTGKDIVPGEMRNLPPDEQVKPWTSGSARAIGGAIGQSPLVVENFIRTSFGGLGAQAMNAADQALASMGAIPEDQIGGETALGNLQRRFGKASGGQIVSKVNEATSKGMSPKETTAYDFLHAGKSVDENGLPADTGLQDSMANASVRLANPAILDKESALAQTRHMLDGSPLNPLYTLNPQQQHTALLISSLPPGNADKKALTNANLEWLKPYWAARDQYISQLKSSGVIKDDPNFLQRPTASPELQAKLDMYNTLPYGTGARTRFLQGNPEVLSFFQESSNFTNAQRADLGLPILAGSSGGGFGSYKKKGPTIKKAPTGGTRRTKLSLPKVSAKGKGIKAATLKIKSVVPKRLSLRRPTASSPISAGKVQFKNTLPTSIKGLKG